MIINVQDYIKELEMDVSSTAVGHRPKVADVDLFCPSEDFLKRFNHWFLNEIMPKYPSKVISRDCEDIVRKYLDRANDALNLNEDLVGKFGMSLTDIIIDIFPEQNYLGLPNTDFVENAAHLTAMVRLNDGVIYATEPQTGQYKPIKDLSGSVLELLWHGL